MAQAHAKEGRWYVDAVFAYFSVAPPADLVADPYPWLEQPGAFRQAAEDFLRT